MIRETFKHCRGIATTLNARLLEAGCHDWQHALTSLDSLPLSLKRRTQLRHELSASEDALARQDIAYLVACFPTDERWRILGHYWPDLSFLDLETTGLSPSRCHITVAALWQQGQMTQYVKGDNLAALLGELERCKLLVTFGGASFDVPRLLDHYRIPSLPCPHIDVRWPCFHHGLRGGQKNIERVLGLTRDAAIAGVDGLEAIALWLDYQAGNKAALERLLGYVTADVAMLRQITRRLLQAKGVAAAFDEA